MAYSGLAGDWVMYTDQYGDLYRAPITVGSTVSVDKTQAFKMAGFSDAKEIIAAVQVKGWVYYLTYMTPAVRLEKARPDGTEATVLDYGLYEIGELVDGQFPDIQVFLRATPDGKWLLYRHPDGDMYKVKTNGQDKQLLYGSSTGIYQVTSVLADNEWVYYVRDDITNERTVYSEVRKVKIDGTGDELIKNVEEYSDGRIRQGLMFSGDKQWILYATGRSLYAFNVENVYEEYKVELEETTLPYSNLFVIGNQIHSIHEEGVGGWTDVGYNKWDIVAEQQGFRWENWQVVDSAFVPLANRTTYGPVYFDYMPDLDPAEDPWFNSESEEGDTAVSPTVGNDSDDGLELVEGSGAYVKFTLTLQKPEICSHITLKPFTKYPLEIVSLKYEEDTETWHEPKELIQHIEETESTGVLRMAFPAVLAKRFTIIVNQKNYEKNVYLIREEKVNDQDLWAKIITREAEVTLDIDDGLERTEATKIDNWTGWDIYLEALERYKTELKAWQDEVDEYNKEYAKYEEELEEYYDVWTEFTETLRGYGYRYDSVQQAIDNYRR